MAESIIGVYNVTSATTYTDKQTGEQKKLYRPIGRATRFSNGTEALELFMFPGQKFSIVPMQQSK